ncbi:hypothetical protein EG68_03663 [Paragonimus skrjabini miyazakii]|uniref:Calponin-homology (CH) domain-containing protein n=1 Tax=Paragonimus skrjabini miyazakii TaxID=59628 RepID=A0A8S9Z142_9TREM|nr:hypothetical protein EG68_03663 [Paragonimus skrjabini miyazakii]
MSNLKLSCESGPKSLSINPLKARILISRKDLQNQSDRKPETKYKLYADWIQRVVRKPTDGNLTAGLKQTFCDGVVLADLISNLTKTTIPNIDRQPNKPESKEANIQHCLAHLQRLGLCQSVNTKDLISGKSKALTEVLDGLFKLQIYTKFDCNMFKETKRTSSVQPSRISAVLSRKLMSSKAGSTSPVRMQTGKILAEKSQRMDHPTETSTRSSEQKAFESQQATSRSVVPQLCYSATASGLPRPSWTSNFNPQGNNSVLGAPPLCRRASSLSYRSSCASPHSGNASSGCSTPTGAESDSPRFPIINSPHTSQAVRPIGTWRNLRSVTPLTITKQYSKIDSISQPGIHTNSAHNDENCHILQQPGGSNWPVLVPEANLKQCQLPSTMQPRNIASFSQQTAINSQQSCNGAGSVKYIEPMQTGVRATFSGNAHNQTPKVKPASRRKFKSTEKGEVDQEPTKKLVAKTKTVEVSLDAAVPLPMSTLSRPLYSKRNVKDGKTSSGLVDKYSSQMIHSSFPHSSNPYNIPISSGSVKSRPSVQDMRRPLVISGRASEPRSFPQRTDIATSLAGTHSVAVVQMSSNHAPTYVSASPEVPISMYVGGTASKLACQMPNAQKNHAILLSDGNTNVVESATHFSYYPMGSMNLQMPQHNIEVSNYADSPSRHITTSAQVSAAQTSPHTFRLPHKGSSLDEISAMAHNPALTASCKLTGSKQHSFLPTSNSATSNLSAADEKQFCDSGISSSSYSKDSACTSPSDQPKQNDHLVVSTVSQRTSNVPSSSQRCCSRAIPNVQYDVPDSPLQSGYKMISKYSENTVRAKSTEPFILLSDRLQVIDNDSKIQQPSALSQSPTSTTSNLSNSVDPKMLSRQKARELYSLVKTRDEIRLANQEVNRSQPILSKASSVPLEPRPAQSQNWSTRPQTLIKTYPTNPITSCVSPCGSNSQVEEAKYAANPDASDCLMSSHGNCYQRKETRSLNDDITYTNITYPHPKALCDPGRSRLASAGQFYEPSKERCGAPSATSKNFNDHGEMATQSRRVCATSACGQRDVNGKPPTSQGGKQKGEVTPRFRRDLEESIDQFLSETKVADQNFPDPSASHKDRARHGSSLFSKSITPASSASFQPDHFDHLTGNPLDPDHFLSSLSKLTLDSNNKNNFWDENYYLSDVESEYAALELLLPFRNSTEQSAYAGDGDDGFLPTRKDAEKSKELGYFSDTETLFQVQKVPRPSTAMGSFADRYHHMNDLFAPSGNCGKLPVASVAPMMATSRQLQIPDTSILSSAVCTSNEVCFQESGGQTIQSAIKTDTTAWDSHILLDPDASYGLEVLKWPRLKSAQSVAHSLSADQSMGLSGGSILTVGSSEVLLNKPNVLENVKLPYPKVPLINTQSSGICSPIQSVRPSVSNYAIHEKSAGLLESVGVTDQSLMNSTPWTGEGDLTTSDTSARIQLNHIERLKKELKQSTIQICALRAQLTDKAQKETTTEKNIQMMTSKIHQLTRMNELKDTEIYELHNTVNQLRADMHRLQLIQEAGSSHTKPTLPLLQQQLLRPPRSPSYRGVLENANPQELMDTMSLNSLTSGASTGSQDTGCTMTTRAGPERSPTPSRAQQADNEPGSGKRSRWVRPSLGKAFKKRSRSSMDSGDRDGDSLGAARSVSTSSGSTATVLTNPGGPWTSLTQSNEKFTKSSHSLEIASPQLETNDDVRDLLMKMRWEMHCLEADNHRLRRLVFNSPHLAEPQDVIDRVPQNSVDLSNLCSRYCDNAVYIVPVFVDTDFCLTGGVGIGNSVEQMASVEGLRLGNKQFISSNPGKLVRIGRVGIKPNSSWCDLDCDMANVLEDYIRFIDPDKRLGLEPVKMTAYQLRCYTSGGSNSPDLTRSVLRFRSETSRTDMVFKPPNKELEKTLPKAWVEHEENDVVIGNIELLTILCLSPVQHMKLDATGYHESDLELLAFETLLPVDELRAYQSVVHTHRFSVLCGPTGTGKSKIIRKMAASIWRNSGTDNEKISKFSIKPNGSSTVEDILYFVEDSLDVNSQKNIIVLENLHNIHGAVEQLVEALFRKYSEARLIILATSDFRNKEMDSLQVKGMIRVLEHLSDIDDTTEFLACYLRRKLVQTRLAELNNTEVQVQLGGLVHDQQILTQLISWIPKVWKYLNRLFLPSLQTQCPTVISLRVFLSCPIDVRASRKWFTDLWNNLFIPFLFRARSTEQMLQSQSMALSASLDWIMATWPWPRATTDLMLQTPYMSHSSTNPLHSPTVEGSPSSPSDCCLNTFGVPKSNSTIQKQRGLENRSSLDSGIVPDGYSTTNVSVGASNLHCETQPFTGLDLSERLTVNHLLTEVRNSEATSQEAIGYMMTNLTSHV